MKIYSEDNQLFDILSRIGDLIILNILFILGCLPVITIGTSLTAMYSVVNKMIKKECINVIPEYINAFRENWRQSLFLWIIILALTIILWVDIEFLKLLNNSILLTLIYGICILGFIIVSYLFPTIAYFHNTIFHFIKNSIVFSLLNPVTTISIVFFNSLIFIMIFIGGIWMQGGLFLYLLCGFSFVAYRNGKALIRVFEKYSSSELNPEN